jgi:hypothetical protein
MNEFKGKTDFLFNILIIKNIIIKNNKFLLLE